MEEREIAKDNLILEVVTGSHLYGFSTTESDTDYQGVFIPTKEYVYGFKNCEQVISTRQVDGVDKTIFNLIKFINLAKFNNPNIISILYTPKNRICFINDYGRMLMMAADKFLSKECYRTYRGYAHGQRSKLMTKNPEPYSKRNLLIEKYGYDTKFACHLIRLLYECLEILVEGKIIYPLSNSKQFLKIRNGECDLNYILAEVVRLENLIDEAYVRSPLQNSPDLNHIESLQMELLELQWLNLAKKRY